MYSNRTKKLLQLVVSANNSKDDGYQNIAKNSELNTADETITDLSNEDTTVYSTSAQDLCTNYDIENASPVANNEFQDLKEMNKLMPKLMPLSEIKLTDENSQVFVPKDLQVVTVCEVPELENIDVSQNKNGLTPLPNHFEIDTTNNLDVLEYEPPTLSSAEVDQEVTEYIVEEQSGLLVEVPLIENYQDRNIGKNPLNLPYSSSEDDTDDSSLDLFSLRRRILRKRNREINDDDRNEKVLSRWKKSDPAKWHRNKYKDEMSKCQKYSSKKGKVRPAKTPQNSSCGNSCRFQCRTKFNEDERVKICKEYWGLKTYERKMDFILRNVDVNPPQSRRPRKGENSKIRSNAKQYHFYKGNEKHRVCQAFFMKTLNINNGPIITAFKKRNSLGVFEGEDGRGKKASVNKTSEFDLGIVKTHIESFPAMESHYRRKSTKRLYLDPKLSISKMYELYKAYCIENNCKAVSSHVYRKTFCTCYNISFFKPKKDQCSTCNRYRDSNDQDRSLLEEEYNNHITRKNEAARSKEIDKATTENRSEFLMVTFDLQSVLQIPSSDVSPMYYSRKINMYNLTVYEAPQPHRAYCFAWTELHGKRGSCEIGTSLYNWFKGLTPEVKHVTLYSDTCGGQNRNQNIAAVFLYIVQTTPVDIIEHKFLESGHSYMEVDSMHSAIEKEKKYQPVYVIHDWLNIFKRARSQRNRNKFGDPFIIKEFKFDEFLNLQELSRTLLRNKTNDSNNDKVNWLKVKCFRFQKIQPGVIEYRYDYFGDYKKIHIEGNKRRTAQQVNFDTLKINKLYKNMLPISVQKKADLLKLCKKGAIPNEYHYWYESLPTSTALKDVITELGYSDSESDSS